MGRTIFPLRTGIPVRPVEAAAPDQVHQDGLRVVPSLVAGGDEGAALLFRRLLQKGVPHLPGALLQSQAQGGSPGGHLALPHGQGDLLFSTPIPDEFHVPAGSGAEPMVIVGGADGISPRCAPSSRRHSRYMESAPPDRRTAPLPQARSGHSGNGLSSVVLFVIVIRQITKCSELRPPLQHDGARLAVAVLATMHSAILGFSVSSS